MKSLSFIFVFINFLTVNSFAVIAPTVLEFKTSEGMVEFTGEANPGKIGINGEAPLPRGTLSVKSGRVSGELTVDLQKLDTKNPLQTKVLKEKALETAKYPEAKLTFTDLKLLIGADSVPFYGNLELHGVIKSIQGTLKFERKDDLLAVHSDFKIKLSNYAVKVPKFAGAAVDDVIAISVDTLAILRK